MRENITILAPSTHVISSVSVAMLYCNVDGQNELFHQNLMVPLITRKFGNETSSLRTKQAKRHLDSFAHFLL